MKQRCCVSVDLGASNFRIGFIEVSPDSHERKIVYNVEKSVILENGKPEAKKTLEDVAKYIKDGMIQLEREYDIVKVVGMQHPGSYSDESRKRIDIKTLPNFPSLCEINNPSEFLVSQLGSEWKCYCENDAFTQGKALRYQYFSLHPETPNTANFFYFGPGTGFGSCALFGENDTCHLYDVIVEESKKLTSEELLGGWRLEKLLNKPVNEASVDEMINVIKEEIAPNLVNLIEILTNENIEIVKKFTECGSDLNRKCSQTKIVLLSGYFAKEPCCNLLPNILNTRFPNMTFKIMKSETLLSSTYLIPEIEMEGMRIGYEDISRTITGEMKSCYEKKKNVIVGIDGYIGITFNNLMEHLKKHIQEDPILEENTEFIDFSEFYTSHGEIEKLIEGLIIDSTFGRLFNGTIKDILNLQSIEEKIVTKLNKEKMYIIYGLGSSYLYCNYERLKFDLMVYRDLTREELMARNKKAGGMLPSFGSSSSEKKEVHGPSYLASKSRHYFDFPIINRLKKDLFTTTTTTTINKNFGNIMYYMDESSEDSPKMIPFKNLKSKIEKHVLQKPFQLKSYYDQGVWGGQWLKKVRDLSHLSHLKVNCAWSYEIMAYMMGIEIPIGRAVDGDCCNNNKLEIPFSNVLDIFGEEIIGPKLYRYFNRYFPTRVNYDDNFQGDDMAVQVHPDHDYNMKYFGEPLHQDESYYIIDCDEGAYVHLGVKDDINIEDFEKKCTLAHEKGVKFDHKKYVNVFPAKKHDLFLIPAGTVHCSGRGSVVLELSATTDRYTFHFYDYLRLDLHGKLRGIHLDHSFRMLRKHPNRTKKFVEEQLIQKPKMIFSSQNGSWKEFMIGYLKYIVFKVTRIEWSGKNVIVKQNLVTGGSGGLEQQQSYHILCLVEGSSVIVRTPKTGQSFNLLYSYSLIVPYSVGEYEIIRNGEESDDFTYKILKVLPNIPVYE